MVCALTPNPHTTMKGKPKLKDTILKYNAKPQTILKVLGELVQIEDKEGIIWSLLELLDGTNTYKSVFEKLNYQYPHLNSALVEQYIEQFVELNILEDATLMIHDMLDEYTMERWSRNIEFFGSIARYGDNKFVYQRKIKESKLCILGCGGLGTHLLLDSTAAGFTNITIVDFDKVELSNLNRQILYHEDDIGTSKVLQARKRALQFSKRANVKAIETWLDSQEKIESVITGHDLVMCVADKPTNAIGYWLNEACVNQQIPFINGGLHIRRGTFYSVVPTQSGCVACWKQSLSQQGRHLASLIVEKSKEHDVDYQFPAPAMVAVVAGCMVAEALKLITGMQPPALTNRLKEFSFDNMSIETREIWEKQPDCSVCGPANN